MILLLLEAADKPLLLDVMSSSRRIIGIVIASAQAPSGCKKQRAPSFVGEGVP
jgi:hypothetical protein